MATTTQNLGLIKPAGTDKIRIAQINSNMDTIDTKMGPVGSTPLQTQATNAASSISALQNGMAIVCNGNTHAAIPSGSYAYVRNHSSLAEGLYQATKNISANATLSTSNLVAVPDGGINNLNAKIAALPSAMNTGAQSGKLMFTAGWCGMIFTGNLFAIGDSYSGGVRILGSIGNSAVLTVDGLIVTYDSAFKPLIVYTTAGSQPTYSAS